MFPTRAAYRGLASLALITLCMLVPAIAQNSATVPPLIIAPIDDSVRVTIQHSTHPLAIPAFDVGPLDGTTKLDRMILVLRGSPDQEYLARTLLDSQQTKGSAQYHQWLTPEEYGQKFGPSQQDVAQVTGWLQQHGFTVGSVARSGLWLEFSGTSAQVEEAFQIRMRQYLVQGELHVANAADISIPAALSPVVRSVLSLHNFFSRPMLIHSPQKGILTSRDGKPAVTFVDGSHGVAPGDFAKIYDLTPLYNTTPTALNGAGKTIAVVAVSNINLSDVSIFQQDFGLPTKQPNVILNGPDPGVIPTDDGAEASLDTEWSGAIAPGATIDVVVSAGTLTTDPVALGTAFIVDQDLSDVMSVSFGNCESALGAENPFWNSVFEQAAAQGISVFVASGDTGAAGCDPNAPSATAAQGGVAVSGVASTPFNTAVGGTEFNETANGGSESIFWNTGNGANLSSVIGYIPEEAWNESCSPMEAGSLCAQSNEFLFLSGGGGVSAVYQTPSYQTLNVTGLSALSSFTLPNSTLHPRGLPDLALTAAAGHDPYVFCFSTVTLQDCVQGTVSIAGGTSFSSPSFAGIMAIVDQKLAGRQGLANYVLYPLAAKETFSSCNSSSRTNPGVPNSPSCVFNDTTFPGNNGVPGNDVTGDPTAGALGYPTATGYDLATGLGSVDGSNLVTAWASLASGFQGTTTTLSASFNGTPLPSNSVTIEHGQTVSVSVSVARQGSTGTPSGNVSLIASGGNLPASGVGIAGEAIAPTGTTGTAAVGPVNVNNLPGGTNYNLQANYPGDGIFGSSPSNTINVTVGPENTTTTLKSFLVNANTGAVTAGATSVAYGDPVNILFLNADVVGSSGLVPASGTVTFNVPGATGGQSGQSGIDSSGIAQEVDCAGGPFVGCIPPGQHAVTASYSGDANPPLSYNASPTSNPLTITVGKGNPIPTVQSFSTVASGVPFLIGVSISTGLGMIGPTGTVQYFDGANTLGGPVPASTGEIQVTFNGVGTTHSITAQYSGDSTYNGATSAPFIINVATPFNLTSTAPSQTIAAGGTATYNVNLNGVGGFTAQVSFNCTGAPGGSTCTVSPNPANLNIGNTPVPLTVTVTNTANAKLDPSPFKTMPFAFAGVLALVFVRFRRKPRQRLLLVLAAFLVGAIISCGGGGGSTSGAPTAPAPPPTNATLVVTGTSGQITNSITLSLTVTH